MHRDSCPLDCKVYVGNLGNNGNKTELERAFGYYGPLRSVWVARNPPGFAFVEFEDPRDAADAVRELDGRTLCGCRVRVELSNGEKRSRNRGPPPSWGRRPRDDYRRRSPPPRRRVTIMSLLTTLWVCISQSTSPFSVMWPARPIQLGWCRFTWPRHGQSSGCTALWFPSMLFSLSLLSNLNQIGSSHLDRPHIPGQSAQLFIYQMSSQQLQQQPSANKKAGKIHNTPFANQLNPTQHLAKPFQQILPGRQSGSLTSPFLACWNPKLISKTEKLLPQPEQVPF